MVAVDRGKQKTSEKVQKRALRMVSSLKSGVFEERIKEFELTMSGEKWHRPTQSRPVLRIRTFLPDPEISPPNPDPDPALVVFKKLSVSVNPDPVLTGSGSGLFSEVGSGSGPNRSGSATLVQTYKILTGKERVRSETWFQLASGYARVTRSAADTLNLRQQ